ncbi:hypothetical protein [Mycolicibacterium sp. S3B2]|uniref:hypothetical protein n=1 Tax=Mycolicibacterium sp. S3B2 TaxID=3415120 RepID=UPI003C7C4485
MSSYDCALQDALTRPANGPVSVPALTWLLTGTAFPRPVVFDVVHAHPSWSGSLDL